MPTRARLAVAIAIAFVSAAGIVVLAVHWLASDTRAAVPRGLRETRAVRPFAGYREVGIEFGSRCVRVVVADTPAKRERGLRGVANLGAYGGMLFAQRSDSSTAFTMAGVSAPLDITWYSSAARSVGASRLRPCPHAGAAQCPVYANARPYRFALETPDGVMAPGALLPCG